MIVVEAVFVYPGLGQLMVDGTAKRDLPVVQACAMIFACAFIGLNVLADVVGTLANPRIRHPR
ncbi:Glutathione transport system permease protein GsiC [compost metagenome]